METAVRILHQAGTFDAQTLHPVSPEYLDRRHEEVQSDFSRLCAFPAGALGNEKVHVALRVSARVSFEKRSIHRVQLHVLGPDDEIHSGQRRQLTELGVRERGLARSTAAQGVCSPSQGSSVQ